MTKYFDVLSENEYRELKDAMLVITALIAGADGEIDEKEKEWASKVANIRTYSGPEILKAYYRDATKDFDEKLYKLIIALPKDAEKSGKMLSEKLSEVNKILGKLDQTTGATFYESFVTFAEHIAKASGGFMRMWSVSKAEAKLVKLPMLNKIEFPEIDEEE